MNSYYSNEPKNEIKKLIENNLELVRKIAWQIFGKVNNVVEIEDLIQQGMEGLIHAAQKYTHKEGVEFPQYAYLRIRGSIIDYLRKNSNHFPHLFYYRINFLIFLLNLHLLRFDLSKSYWICELVFYQY